MMTFCARHANEHMTWDELGRRETDRYLTDLRALNVEPPTYYVRATDEIPMMISVIEQSDRARVCL